MLKSIMQYWPILNLVFGAVGVWICWSLRQLAKTEVQRVVDVAKKAVDRELEKVDGQVSEHEKRIARSEMHIVELRADLAALPTKADFARLEAELGGVAREVTAVSNGVGRIEGFFLKKGVENA